MANPSKEGFSEELKAIYQNLRLLMRDPLRGCKAALTLFNLFASTALISLVCFKLDWKLYSPFIVLLAIFITIILFLAINFFIMRIFIKTDKYHV